MQVGGPLGAYFPAILLDTPLDYESMAAAKGMLGHGGLVVFDDTRRHGATGPLRLPVSARRKAAANARPAASARSAGVETVDRIIAGRDRQKNVELLRDLCEVMTDGSLCALGGLTPLPVLSALDHFSEDFAKAPARAAAE